MRTLIRDCAILPMTGKGDFIPVGYLALDGSKIKEIGALPPEGLQDELADGWKPERIIQGENKLAMPGFVNTHTHAAMTLFRGFADDMRLQPWLEERIYPAEDRLTEEDVYWGTLLACLEMLKSGTTCFADMYFFMDHTAQAVKKSGMRASLSRGLVGLDPTAGKRALAENVEFVRNWEGQAQGRIHTRLGPHAPYTCPQDFLQQVIIESDTLGVGLHIHLAETQVEVTDLLSTAGQTPINYMEQVGLFQRPVLAAHCVHVSAEEIALLQKHQVGVAHNPESNMKLASGIAPIAAMLKAGVPVGLGTDGSASNNNLDLLQEMRSASLLQKVATGDPTVLPAYQALEIATLGGARCLGLASEIGCLIPGQKADLILIDLQKPHLYPRHDFVAHLVYSAIASDVDTVFIDGEMVVEKGEVLTLNESEILDQAEARAQRLVRNL